MYSNSSKMFKSPTVSPSESILLNFNGEKLMNCHQMMSTRGLSKHINCIPRKDMVQYGKFKAFDSVTNCNLLLPILKCFPYVLFQAMIQFSWNDHDKVIHFLKNYLVKNLQLMDLSSLDKWAAQDNSHGKVFWESIACHFQNKYLCLLDMVTEECVNGSVNYTAQV